MKVDGLWSSVRKKENVMDPVSSLLWLVNEQNET